MTEDDAADYIAEGEYRAQHTEARRCLTILRHPEAVARPVAAWMFLPLHKSVEDTIDDLREQPIECGEDGKARHARNIQFFIDFAACIARNHAQLQAQFATIN